MKRSAAHWLDIALIVKRAIEGKISPLNFLIILGFFSSIVLLYVSFRVHYSTISEDINAGHSKLERLMNINAQLHGTYNDLTSYERIIPLALELGLRACSQGEVRRLAVYENEELKDKEPVVWEQAEGPDSRNGEPEIDLKGR
jgi:hypothetical protein